MATMKKKYIVLIVVAVLIAAFAIASVIAVKTASHMIEEKKQNILGLALEIKSYYVDWMRGRIVLEGVAIYPAGKVDEKNRLASAEKLIVVISPKDIWKKKELHATEIVFEKPDVSYIRFTRKSKNWDALDLSQLGSEEKKDDKPSDDGFKVRIDSVTINNGHAIYVNHADGGRLELNNLNVEINDIIPEPDPKKLPTAMKMSARIGNTSGHFTMKGKANFLAKGINFKTTANLSPMPVTYFAPFYAGSVPFPITTGSISVGSTANADESMLTSNHHITISGLRVGGGMKADLINQFILSQSDRISVDAAVNGDLETGDISMSHTASKVIVDQLMAGAMKQVPITKAGEMIIKQGEKNIPGTGTGRQIGDKMKGLFGH
jgi:hypothetical protein